MVSEYTVSFAHPAPTITRANQIGVGFSGHHRLVRETGGHTTRYDAEPGAVYVTGNEPITWLEVRDPTEALEIYPDLTGQNDPVELRPALAVRDGTVLAVAARLRGAHLALAPLTDVAASTLCHLLVARLLDTYSPSRTAAAPGRLPAAAVDVIHEYVRHHLHQPLSLDALAAAVSSSPFHFARGFKATTGTTPHAFVTEVRMVTARDLLLRSTGRVEDIAIAVGFTNVGHFRRLFRRHFGVTPAAMRSARHEETARSDPRCRT